MGSAPIAPGTPPSLRPITSPALLSSPQSSLHARYAKALDPTASLAELAELKRGRDARAVPALHAGALHEPEDLQRNAQHRHERQRREQRSHWLRHKRRSG